MGAQSRAGHSSCRHWVGWRWLNAEPASSAVQVGFFCPARAFGACTSNPEHSTAPRGRDGNPHHQTLCVLRPACPPPGPTLPAPPAWGGGVGGGGACKPQPPRACRCRTSEAPGGFGGGCPAWKWELCPPSPGLGGCRWAGQEAYRRLGDPVPVVVTGGRCHACAGTPPGASATPDRGTNDDNRSRRWLCSRARFRVAATMGNVASHLSRGGNYASRGRRARSKHRLARREIWNTVHTTNDVVPRLQPFDDCRRLDIHDAQQTAQLSKPTRSLFITKNNALPIYP